jgi:hypothetical protein
VQKVLRLDFDERLGRLSAETLVVLKTGLKLVLT